MTDPASHRLSRSPTANMSRPAHSPMGPRTRFQRSPSEYASRDSMLSIGEPSPAYPSSPARSDAPSLPPIAEFVVTPPPPTPSASSTTSSPTPPPMYIKAIPKPATLVSAPILTFESVPVQWKALPHEAALWTLEKRELQELVSRALRRSAPETYIRLLSLENLDNALPAEIDRLTTLKATKQSQYRFLVQRRTMTLQALNSSFISPEKAEADDGIPTASKLAQQLSQTTAACDELMLELLVISDQLTQISNLTEHHYASALAVALRKLNKSYAKRTQDVMSARQRISELEVELEEAWKEAERAAKELDEIQANPGTVPLEQSSDEEEEEEEEEEAVIETAEKFKVHSRHASRIPAELLIQSRRNTGHMEALPLFSPLSPMPRLSAMSPPTSTGSEPQLMTPLDQDRDDAASMRSTKSARSGRSGKSMRSPDSTRLSLVSSARTRSMRASKNSLRLSRPKTPAHPPMPDLPIEFASTPLPSHASRSSAHIWKDSASRISNGRSRRTSVDDIRPLRSPSRTSLAPTVTMDDIYIRLQSQMPRQSEDDVQLVRRSPPPMPRLPVHPSKSIPNMWLMGEKAAAPAPPKPERFPSLKRPAMPTQTYQKLKNYTKRYSLPFPFKNKSASSPTGEVRSVSSSKSAPTRFG